MKDELHFTAAGNSRLPAIIFLHGFMGSAEDWAPVVERLKEHYYCLAIDLPGHGKSLSLSSRKLYDMPRTAALVVELLERLKVKRVSLVGYSMGGRLGLYLALKHPSRFQKVVLESASPGLKTAAERAERRKQDERLAQELEHGRFDEFLEKWYRNPLFASLRQHPDFAHLRQRRLKNDPRELAKSLRAMGTGSQPSLWEELKSNKIPLLLLAGEFDVKFNRLAAEVAVTCPAARVKVISGCGHNVHFEKRGEFADSILFF